MPKSMTGFGRGECIRYDRRFKIELKSVNHRFSEFAIKLPRFLNPFEDRIRKRLAKDITRGKVDVWITFDSFTQKDIIVQVNEGFADAYVEALNALSNRYSLEDMPASTAINLLARNPEVLTFDKFESAMSDDTQHELWETLSVAMEEAMIQYNSMRETEGRAMVEDIKVNHAKAMSLLDRVIERAPKIIDEHAAKLKERITEMMAKMGQKPDESRMYTEIALMADKGCISEEIARLESHLQQLLTMLDEDAVGRKMDFLMQELNREANTIGSKSSDVQMTKLAVELKSIIEKIREQVQNIE